MKNGFKEETMDREYLANLILSVFLGLLVIVAVTRFGSALTPKGLFVSDPHPSSVAKSMHSDVFLTKYTIVKEPNHKVKAVFYVRNNSQQDVKNLSVLCEFYGQNGSFLDRKRWFLGAQFPAGKETSMAPPQERYVNLGTTINCSIDDLQIAKAPAFTLHRATGGGHGKDDGGTDSHSHKASGH